jgi:hypothetical protein
MNVFDDNRCVIDYLSDAYEEQARDKKMKRIVDRHNLSVKLSIGADELSGLVEHDVLFEEQVINLIWELDRYLKGEM